MSRASHGPHPWHDFVEYLTMRRAEAYVHRLGEPRRAELAELLDIARQRAAAAHGLWSVGHTVEAMALARDALDDTVEVAKHFAALERGSPSLVPPALRANAEEPPAAGEGESRKDGDPDVADEQRGEAKPGAPLPEWAQVLRATGLSEVGLHHALRAIQASHRTDFPRLERHVTREHREIVHDLLRVRLALDDAVSTGTLTHREIRGLRAGRRTALAALAITLTAGLVWALAPERGAFATASGVWASSADYQPDRVLDGDETTMWILPDGTPGWLEVALAPAQRVERVSLVNAGAPTLRDRGTRRYRLEIYAGGSLARSLDGELADGLERTRATHDVGVDGVERIRFVVESHRGLGGGLAELRWE